MSNAASIQDKIEGDRTFQANARTFLEYLRTGLGLLVAGVVIVYFSQGDWFWAVGIICLLIAIIIDLVGATRFRNMNQRIALVQQPCGVGSKRKKD